MGLVLFAALASIFIFNIFPGLNADNVDDLKLVKDSFVTEHGNDDHQHSVRRWKRQNVPVGVPYPSPVRRFLQPRPLVQPRPSPYIVKKLPGYMPIPRGNIWFNRPAIPYPPLRYAPIQYGPVMQRSQMPVYNPYYRPMPLLYTRGWSAAGNILNANTGTNSHTISGSVLKAPGHTQTNTHVITKQQTGGKIGAKTRGMPRVPLRRPKMPYSFYQRPNQRPFYGLKSFYARARAPVRARVNAKAGSRTTSSSGSGGWGYGAGAGYGTGPGAWGVGGGGGAGGSAGSIPSGLTGIPGLSSGYPGIPAGFPGMPPGGFPGQKSPYAGAQANKARKPVSSKKKPVVLKPKKGIKAAFKIKKGKYDKPRYQLRPINPAMNNRKRPNAQRKNFAQRAVVPLQPYRQMPMYRVQYFTNNQNQRPFDPRWQSMRQRIISNVMRG